MANPREEKPVLHTKKHLARLERERIQTRIVLYTFIGILIIVVGLIGYAILYNTYLQARQPVAKIGNVNISIGDWQARVRLQTQNLQNEYTIYQQYSQMFGMDFTQQLDQISQQLTDRTSLGQSVLDQMIDEELIRQEAAKRGITANKAEVDTSIQSVYSFYPNGSPTPTITPTRVVFPTLSPQTLAMVTITPTPTLVPTPEFTATPVFTATAVAPTATGTPGPTETPYPTPTAYTLQGFQKAYQTSLDSSAKMGISADQVRAIYEVSILRQKLMDAITANTPHTQDQVWARHILVKDEATAKDVRQQLLNGADFAALAAKYSTDTGTKDKGGDLGWFPKQADALTGQTPMVPEFEKAAFSLKVGEISQPVKSQFGYHIIQVLAHQAVPLDASTYEQARQTAFNNWLTKARTDYKVITYNNWQNLIPTLPAAATAVSQ